MLQIKKDCRAAAVPTYRQYLHSTCMPAERSSTDSAVYLHGEDQPQFATGAVPGSVTLALCKDRAGTLLHSAWGRAPRGSRCAPGCLVCRRYSVQYYVGQARTLCPSRFGDAAVRSGLHTRFPGPAAVRAWASLWPAAFILLCLFLVHERALKARARARVRSTRPQSTGPASTVGGQK